MLHVRDAGLQAVVWLRDSIGIANLFTGVTILSVPMLLVPLAVPRQFAQAGAQQQVRA